MKKLIVEIDINERPVGLNLDLLHLVASPSSVSQEQLLRTIAYRLEDEDHHIRLRWQPPPP